MLTAFALVIFCVRWVDKYMVRVRSIVIIQRYSCTIKRSRNIISKKR